MTRAKRAYRLRKLRAQIPELEGPEQLIAISLRFLAEHGDVTPVTWQRIEEIAGIQHGNREA